MTGFPAVDAPRSWAAPLRSLTGLGALASILIVLTAVLNLAGVWAHWHSADVVQDFLQGHGVRADLVAADGLTRTIVLSGAAVQTLAGIVFLMWLWRARTNSEVLSLATHRHTRGWTIGGWFCPVVNFWFPQRIVTDIWRTSRPEAAHVADVEQLPGSRLVAAWWVLYILASLADRYFSSFEVGRAMTVGQLRDGVRDLFVADVVIMVAAVLAVVIINQITTWQRIPRTWVAAQ